MIDRIIVKEISGFERLTREMLEQWADGIPIFSENDPLHPEWRATPTLKIDLRSDGYGMIDVKDESDRRSNPTGTIKDRAAWELVCVYRDFARGILLKKGIDESVRRSIDSSAGESKVDISQLAVPRLCAITSGNFGRSFAYMFQKMGLPPLKLLVDSSIPDARLEALKALHADIYMAELDKRELSPEEIRALTNNKDGIDITSARIIEPHAVFYDWHVHEAFNTGADEIYVPFGSGRIFENYLTWQFRDARNPDPRLRIPVEHLVNINILGAEPASLESAADKLTKCHNPFRMLDDQDISSAISLSFTGTQTRVYRVREDLILHAYDILSRYVDCEPSGAAGLALYMQRWEKKLIGPETHCLIINTGRGI